MQIFQETGYVNYLFVYLIISPKIWQSNPKISVTRLAFVPMTFIKLVKQGTNS